ncbi:MAG TPA: T9SS type A sorting domain-containing protein [Edaphocola sp.]|nr:T9SS type A sorting domain-containing protein [Edaphocola sp.]
MRKTFYLIPLLLTFGFISNAQTVKNADISVQITAPANNVVVPYGDSASLSFNYTNNGPDILPDGDSLFFYVAGVNIVLYSKLIGDLPVGTTIAMNDMILFYNPGTTPVVGEICVLHLKQSDVTYQDGGVPNTTYLDAVSSNDTSCINVTLEGENNTSIQNPLVNNENLSIAPNPAKDKIKVELLPFSKELKIQIVNSFGQELWQDKIIDQKKDTIINIENLPSGIYFIRQSVDEKTSTIKFIKL